MNIQHSAIDKKMTDSWMLNLANTKITGELVFICVKSISETITGILCHAVQYTI